MELFVLLCMKLFMLLWSCLFRYEVVYFVIEFFRYGVVYIAPCYVVPLMFFVYSYVLIQREDRLRFGRAGNKSCWLYRTHTIWIRYIVATVATVAREYCSV